MSPNVFLSINPAKQPPMSQRRIPSSGSSAFDEALQTPLLSSTGNSQSSLSSSITTNSRSSSRYSRRLPPQKTNARSGGNDDDDSLSARLGNRDIPKKYSEKTDSTDSEDDERSLAVDEFMIFRSSVMDLDSALVRERYAEMSDIKGSMRQINDIYKDLATIVNDQQQDIDDMEANATQTEHKTSKGVEHVEKASNIQKSTNKITVAFFIVMIFVIIGLVCYFIFAFRKKS